MKIEIRNSFTGKIIIAGEYASVKDALEKNRNKDLSGVDLRGANLTGVDLRVANLTGADLRGAYLTGVDLRGAYLTGVDLRGAYLTGANLTGAYLSGAENYVNSRAVLAELIRRLDSKAITAKQWAIIGMIIVHSLCWDTIKKRFGKDALPIFHVLAKQGFDEFEKKYSEVLK